MKSSMGQDDPAKSGDSSTKTSCLRCEDRGGTVSHVPKTTSGLLATAQGLPALASATRASSARRLLASESP